jgi:uncharacterized membrane protein YdjX (TVP38/TMEM64 family)
MLSAWVERTGPLGPVLFGAFCVLAALFLIPGSALTLASGSVFGLVKGVITISISSTTAAALAFLIARYLARSRVEARARSMPRFAAIDRAIGEGGAKIVALLRLSPAVPFSLGNYMFGLTAVGFWPYVIASWIFMLPGTVMYVYVGLVAKESLATAAGGQGGKTAGEWALLVAVVCGSTGSGRRRSRCSHSKCSRRGISSRSHAVSLVLRLDAPVALCSLELRALALHGHPPAILSAR